MKGERAKKNGCSLSETYIHCRISVAASRPAYNFPGTADKTKKGTTSSESLPSRVSAKEIKKFVSQSMKTEN